MVTIQHAQQDLHKALCTIYEAREATTITSIVVQTIFSQKELPNNDISATLNADYYHEIKSRLLKHEPWQYVLEQADFYGLIFKVSPSVLIPRPETEELVHWILKDLKSYPPLSHPILDVGTGSGCIAVTLKHHLPDVEVWGIDYSKTVLDVAQTNAKAYNLSIDFRQMDILNRHTQATLSKVGLIVSNPPYIPQSERQLMASNVLDYEPSNALFVSNEKPLIFYEALADLSLDKLQLGGWLYVEVNTFHATAVVALFEAKGLVEVTLRKDLQGRDRMIRARRS